MMSKIKLTEQTLLTFSLILIPFSDVITGVGSLFLGLYSGNNQSEKMITLIPGMISRLILFSIMIYGLLKRKSTFNGGIATFLFLIVFFFIESYSFLFYSQKSSNLFLGFIYAYKVSFIICAYFYFVIFNLCENKESLKKSLRVTFFIYILAIVLGHLSGKEYTTYGGVGSSGWLISGSANSIAIIYGMCLPLVYDYVSKFKFGFLYVIFVFSISLYSSLLLMTKSSIVLVFVITLIFFYYRYKKIIFYSIISTLSIPIIWIFLNFDLKIVSRIESVLRYYEGNWIGVIFSGRQIHAEYAFNILSNYSWQQLLFGVGYAQLRSNMGAFLGKDIGVEIDVLDLLTMHGMLITLAYLGIILITVYLMRNKIKKMKNNKMKPSYFSYCILIVLSFIAGHVMMSGMNGHLLPILASIVIYSKTIETRN